MIVDDSPVFIWSEPVITVTDCIVTFVVLPIVAITSYVLLMIMAKRKVLKMLQKYLIVILVTEY